MRDVPAVFFVVLFAVLVFFSALSFLDADFFTTDFFTADFFAGDFLSDVFETLRVLFAAVVLVSVINGLVSCSEFSVYVMCFFVMGGLFQKRTFRFCSMKHSRPMYARMQIMRRIANQSPKIAYNVASLLYTGIL